MIPQTTALLSSAAVSVAPSFVRLCSTLAAPASVLVSAAPLPTIREIQVNKNVGNLPLLPYSCMAANCVLWTTYGALKHTPSIWIPNGVGVLLALFYIHSFLENAMTPDNNDSTMPLPEEFKWHIGGVAAVVATAACAFQCQSFFSATAIADHVGHAAVLFCMALFASPLAALKTVMETKSADSIPLPFTIASLLCCFLWAVTGVLELHDMNVILPNTIGFMFGLAQVALKLQFSGNNTPELPSNNLLSSTEVVMRREELAMSMVREEEERYSFVVTR